MIRRAPIVVAVAVAAVVAVGCSGPTAPVTAPAQTGPVQSGPMETGSPGAGPIAGADRLVVGRVPTRVAIPAIDLDEPLIDLGLTGDGAMAVPTNYDDVGWFVDGGRPGGVGPTVIAGHVDSVTGPAVFDRLEEVSEGDMITVETVGGPSVTYRVVEVSEFDKVSLPTVRVFGATATDQIRLITCSGDFDASVGSYESNLVVFGVPV